MRNNRRTKIGLAIGLAALLWGGGAAELSAAGGHRLVGAWTVTILPDGGGKIQNLAASQADGTISNWDPTFGAGFGTWERTGRREFAVKFVHFADSASGLPPGTEKLVVRALLTLKSKRARAAGPFVTTFVDGQGNALASFGGTVRLDRIVMD